MNPKKLESSLKIEKKNSVNEKRGEKSPVKKVVENAFSYSNSNAVGESERRKNLSVLENFYELENRYLNSKSHQRSQKSPV